jgi:hypothetical protein
MNDTAAEVAERVRQYHQQLTPEQRWRIASDMFEVTRLIVESSLPADMTPAVKRRAVIKRFYGLGAAATPAWSEKPECFASGLSVPGAASAGARVCSVNALRPSFGPTAINGISHNFYWLAKPTGIVAVGNVFSTLRVLPLLLLTLDAWQMRHSNQLFEFGHRSSNTVPEMQIKRDTSRPYRNGGSEPILMNCRAIQRA